MAMPRKAPSKALLALLKAVPGQTRAELSRTLGWRPMVTYRALRAAMREGLVVVGRWQSLGWRYGSVGSVYFHVERQVMTKQPMTREQALEVLARYLDRAPMLPDVSSVEGSVARMKWLLGLIDLACTTAQEACRSEAEAAYKAGYEAGFEAGHAKALEEVARNGN